MSVPTHAVGDIVYQWRRPGNPGVVTAVLEPGAKPTKYSYHSAYPQYTVRYASGRTATGWYFDSFTKRLNQLQSQMDKMRTGLDNLNHPPPKRPRTRKPRYLETGEPPSE